MVFWLTLLLVTVVVLFGFVVLVGPPYLPTMQKQTDAALDLLDLQPGQTLLELGSGDGRVMLAAARRGLTVVGIELNPILVVFSMLVTWRYRRQVRVIWGSYWGKPWPRADAIFTFMLTKYMPRLDMRIGQWQQGLEPASGSVTKPTLQDSGSNPSLKPKPVRLASFAFRIPQRDPIDERAGIYLYEYK